MIKWALIFLVVGLIAEFSAGLPAGTGVDWNVAGSATARAEGAWQAKQPRTARRIASFVAELVRVWCSGEIEPKSHDFGYERLRTQSYGEECGINRNEPATGIPQAGRLNAFAPTLNSN